MNATGTLKEIRFLDGTDAEMNCTRREDLRSLIGRP